MYEIFGKGLRWLALGWLGICLGIAAKGSAVGAEFPKPLEAAHAHNDYWHERPLIDALDHGFCSVEADVFLHEGELLVGHDVAELQRDRTLESLYLKPLAERVRENQGRVYRDGPLFFLLIDVKSDAKETYAAVDQLLGKYSAILTTIEKGEYNEKGVTVVISGNRDQETIRQQAKRYAGIDGRASDLEDEAPSHVMPWISENWNNHFRWNGVGAMPADQKAKLRDYVKRAHRRGRLVRFWATPENERVWDELLAAEVDLIGTDDLDRLQRFLSEKSSKD